MVPSRLVSTICCVLLLSAIGTIHSSPIVRRDHGGDHDAAPSSLNERQIPGMPDISSLMKQGGGAGGGSKAPGGGLGGLGGGLGGLGGSHEGLGGLSGGGAAGEKEGDPLANLSKFFPNLGKAGAGGGLGGSGGGLPGGLGAGGGTSGKFSNVTKTPKVSKPKTPGAAVGATPPPAAPAAVPDATAPTA